VNRTYELQQANHSLAVKNTELEKMNKELESFTYVSSHDLQEPLRKIQIFTTRILEKENLHLSDKGKINLHQIQDAAARMQTLIQDLLAFSRISSAERKFETTDLDKIVEEVKAELRESIEEKNAIIEATPMCEANIIPFQFRQLMHNLISNALKFSKPGTPPHIIIKSRNITCSKVNEAKLIPGKEYCHITVTDNGIGFEPKFKDKIFEVFQKLHSKEEYAGTGIGLAIVKKIVDNHHGTITALSELGKGVCFDIYIPVN
jgi:two-component system, chemotaxis family, CheB/CheR fusion protein